MRPWRWLILLLVSVSWGEAASLTFRWTAATDNVAVTGYRLYYRLPNEDYTTYVDVGNVTEGSITGLTANTLYYIAVMAYDAANNLSPLSQETGEMTGPATPSAPQRARLTAMLCQRVKLRWNRALDDVAITEYRVRRDDTQIGTTGGTVRVYDDLTVSPNTEYTYTIRAADASANESADSNSVVVTTPVCP